jgi:hypothetical protein
VGGRMPASLSALRNRDGCRGSLTFTRSRLGIYEEGQVQDRSSSSAFLLRIGRVKALGEPTVDWCQQRAGLGALALLLP